MYIDIDTRYAVNSLLKLYEKYPNALIRETEHGYHIKLPLECSPDNFIVCLVLRYQLGDDIGRISMDILRLSLINEENMDKFSAYFDVVFDYKKKEGKIKIKGKWYGFKEYLTLRGLL